MVALLSECKDPKGAPVLGIGTQRTKQLLSATKSLRESLRDGSWKEKPRLYTTPLLTYGGWPGYLDGFACGVVFTPNVAKLRTRLEATPF